MSDDEVVSTREDISSAVNSFLVPEDVPNLAGGVSTSEVVDRPDGTQIVKVRTSFPVPLNVKQRIRETLLTLNSVKEVMFAELNVHGGGQRSALDMTGFDSSFPIWALFDPRQFARAVRASGNHPPILYHYTNEAGLRGILNPSWDVDHPAFEEMLARAAKLWVSDVRHMDDSQELLFGAAPLVERLHTAAADSSTPPELAATLERLEGVFSDEDVLSWDLRCFVACFSESGDSVSQWKSYAGGADGYAIGFSWEALAEHSFAFHPGTTAMDNNTCFPAGLRQMAYGEAAAEAMADGVVNWLRIGYESPQDDGFLRAMIKGPGRGGPDPGLLYLASIALQQLAVVKHDGWKDQREWRLIAVSEPRFQVKYRPGHEGDVPYLDAPVNMKTPQDAADLPATIAKLVVGPGRDKPGREALARKLLEEHGHDPGVVSVSKLPLRW